MPTDLFCLVHTPRTLVAQDVGRGLVPLVVTSAVRTRREGGGIGPGLCSSSGRSKQACDPQRRSWCRMLWSFQRMVTASSAADASRPIRPSYGLSWTGTSLSTPVTWRISECHRLRAHRTHPSRQSPPARDSNWAAPWAQADEPPPGAGPTTTFACAGRTTHHNACRRRPRTVTPDNRPHVVVSTWGIV